jgi:adhesin HecA-like repeat protein
VSAKDDLAVAIQTAADASGSAPIRIGLGAPGSTVLNRGEARPTGRAYVEPGGFDSILTGVGALSESRGTVVSGGLTNRAGVTIVAGEAVRISTTNGVAKASASAASSALSFVGFVYADAADLAPVQVRVDGLLSAKFVAGLTLAAGDVAYLSTTAGSLTNVAPVTAGQVRYRVGVVFNTASYAGVHMASIAISLGEPTVL